MFYIHLYIQYIRCKTTYTGACKTYHTIPYHAYHTFLYSRLPEDETLGSKHIKKGKVHPCTGTEALYRP